MFWHERNWFAITNVDIFIEKNFLLDLKRQIAIDILKILSYTPQEMNKNSEILCRYFFFLSVSGTNSLFFWRNSVINALFVFLFMLFCLSVKHTCPFILFTSIKTRKIFDHAYFYVQNVLKEEFFRVESLYSRGK